MMTLQEMKEEEPRESPLRHTRLEAEVLQKPVVCNLTYTCTYAHTLCVTCTFFTVFVFVRIEDLEPVKQRGGAISKPTQTRAKTHTASGGK